MDQRPQARQIIVDVPPTAHMRMRQVLDELRDVARRPQVAVDVTVAAEVDRGASMVETDNPFDDDPIIRAAVADWEAAVAAEGELRLVEERRRADAERELEKLAVAIARARHDAVQRHVNERLQRAREG